MVEPWLDDGYHVHAPVGRLRPNGFGLHDVYGNVLEWCRDGYCGDAHALRPGDGERVLPHAVDMRVNRGGGWFNVAASARSAKRDRYKPADRIGGLGLRPANGVKRG